METILANLLTSKPRRERLHGREYLVCAATLIVPDKVLNGSNGPGLYPAEECRRHPAVWNHMPLVLWHPTDGQGNHVSARSPKVLGEHGLGTVFSASADGNLRSEAWFDVELVKNADQKHKGKQGFPLLPRIEAGEPVELSTGLEPRYDWTKGTTNDGVAYDWIARDFKPDHVAVLPDQRGACSVKDGCGINVNACADDCQGCPRCFDDWLLNAGKYGNPQSSATGKFKWLGAGTGKGEAHEAAQRGLMNITEVHRERGSIAALEALQGQNPPSWAADEAKWDKAKSIVEEKMPDCDDYYACAAYIYERIGGVTNTVPEESDMPLSKKEAVTYLTANCDCWKGQDAVLNAMSDDQLNKLASHVQAEVKHRRETEATLNAFKQGIKLGKGGAQLVLNSAGKPVVRNAVHGEDMECDPEDEKCLEMMKGKEKEKEPPPFAGNAGGVDMAKIEASIVKGLGFESIEHAKAVLNSAKQVNEEAKHRIVSKLVGNIQDETKRNHLGNLLMKKPLDELKELAALAPAEQPQQRQPAYNFAPASSGFGGTPALNYLGDHQGDEEVLDLPVMNWAGEKKTAVA